MRITGRKLCIEELSLYMNELKLCVEKLFLVLETAVMYEEFNAYLDPLNYV